MICRNKLCSKPGVQYGSTRALRIHQNTCRKYDCPSNILGKRKLDDKTWREQLKKQKILEQNSGIKDIGNAGTSANAAVCHNNLNAPVCTSHLNNSNYGLTIILKKQSPNGGQDDLDNPFQTYSEPSEVR
jgi:hypothetical protein